jgi:phage portal protein BeeE
LGFFDFLKPKQTENKQMTVAPVFSGSANSYHSAYTSICACDLVMQAIHAKQGEFQKINPKHIILKDNVEVADTASSIAKVLKRPNPFMTQADFFSKIVFLREINKNCYIYPEYVLSNSGKKIYTGLYPLNPQEVKYLVDAGGRYFVELIFRNGYSCTLPVEDIIHWRKDYDGNDYFGGSTYGDKDLLKSINQYDRLIDSIAKAVNASCQVNGLMKVNTYLGDEELDEKRIEFENKLNNNESGIMFMDLKSDYIDLPRDVKLVDGETLNFFYDNILRHTGTPKEILSGKYDKATKESWYERTLEPDLRTLAQAMEKVFFSDREESYGNKIKLYPAAITFMSMENKIAALQFGLPAGMFTRDEARELLGYPPLPNGIGQQIPQGYNNTINTNTGVNSNE